MKCLELIASTYEIGSIVAPDVRKRVSSTDNNHHKVAMKVSVVESDMISRSIAQPSLLETHTKA